MRDISKIILERSASGRMIISSGSQVFERSASSRSALRGRCLRQWRRTKTGAGCDTATARRRGGQEPPCCTAMRGRVNWREGLPPLRHRLGRRIQHGDSRPGAQKVRQVRCLPRSLSGRSARVWSTCICRRSGLTLRALNLCRRAGFEELCTYHYRTAAPGALTIASRAGEHLLSKHSASREIIARSADCRSINLIIYQLI